MKALSIRQPWAFFVLYAGKDIENRSWPTQYRGEILIHAGKLWDEFIRVGTKKINPEMLESCFRQYNLPYKTIKELAKYTGQKTLIEIFPLGGVMGKIEIVDCVRNSQSKWAVPGQWHWVLENPQPLPFYPYKGQLGLFEMKHGNSKQTLHRSP